MLDFTGDAVTAIEDYLEQQWPGGWRRLRVGEDKFFGSRFKAGWRLDLPRDVHSHPCVNFVWLFIDCDFPYTDIRVVAPEAARKEAPFWPHVETHGLLCLKASATTAATSRRVALAVSDAVSVLEMDEAARRTEFEREFVSYWNLQTTQEKNTRSIVTPGGPSRNVVYTTYQGAALFADNDDDLKAWLTNAGVRDVGQGAATRLIALPAGPTPGNYPKIGADVLRLAGPDVLEPLFKPTNSLPVLLEASTPTGAAFACVALNCEAKEKLRRGFRTLDRVSSERIRASYAGQAVSRLCVLRMDRGWVHGRDHDPDAAMLAEKSVTIIGCGALGSEIARLLAQAGVGQFNFVDGDKLSPPNTSRHWLGAADVDRPKAIALANQLARAFPHMKMPRAMAREFEHLTPAELSTLAASDLIVTAGLNAQANIGVGRWRNSLPARPHWECCWTEEFACAGHAVALGTNQSILDLIDETGRPRERLTRTWPPNIGTETEAGCGNAFQPYGAVDMQGTVGVSARLAIDLLLSNAAAPLHRVWMGNRALAVSKGAELSHAFSGSYQEGTLP